MSWERIRLGDVISTLKGFAFKSSHYVCCGYPIVRASNFTLDSISDEDLKFYSYDEANLYKKYALCHNDILIQTVGSWEYNPNSVVGKVVCVPKKLDGALLNQNIVKIIPNENIDNRYLFYRLKCNDFAKYNIGNAVGAANQASITLDTIKDFVFNIPDLPQQKKIAKILSSYDDLIENNQKQIKLLEEAAQRLYKEWFVDLRFPGYENTPITDGVPQGWKQESIDNVYSIKYGKNLPTTEISTNGKYPVYGANGVIGYYDKYNCDAYVTLVTSRGNGSGDVSRTHHSNSFVTNNSFVVIPQQAYDFISNEFTYWLMKHADFKSICTGSAQPQLTNNSISTLKVLVPTKKLILHFCETTRTYFENVESLLKQNRLLTEARERLLPKLMSGELEV